MWPNKEQTKAQIRAPTINGWVVFAKRSLRPFISLLPPFFCCELRNTLGPIFTLNHWPNSNQAISSAKQNRTEHNGTFFSASFSSFRCVGTFSCTCNLMWFTQCILFRYVHSTLKTLKNPIRSIHCDFSFAWIQHYVYVCYRYTFSIHCDLSKDFSRVVVIVDCFLLLFCFFFIHVQFHFFSIGLYSRLINRLSVKWCAQYFLYRWPAGFWSIHQFK